MLLDELISEIKRRQIILDTVNAQIETALLVFKYYYQVIQFNHPHYEYIVEWLGVKEEK